jgi:ABC-type sugar transport system ATPase subunit
MLLKLKHISKTFPGVTALSDLSLSFKMGEVHAICGENGAGKSTLMNIITGNLRPDAGGHILINDEPVVFSSYKAAKEKRIAMVHQERSLVGTMSIAENIFFNHHPRTKAGFINYKTLYKKVNALLAQLQLGHLSPTFLVKSLSPAQAQMIEIAKALAIEPKILILDEPTASITAKETAILFQIIRQLKASGTAIIYISHRLKEIFEIADTVTVLKDGKWQNTLSTKEVTPDNLVTMMVGRELLQLHHTNYTQNNRAAELRNISGDGFSNISFHINKGEIVTLAGLTGAGRSEIAKAIFGALPLRDGEIRLLDKTVHFTHTSQAIAHGVAYVAEERKQQSIFADMNVVENIMAAKFAGSGFQKFVSSKEAFSTAEKYKTELHIAIPSLKKTMKQLSGGNQQKAVLARWLAMQPVLLIADEPTHGVDVGAKFEIYQLLQQLASRGTAILLISSDMLEVLALSNRIVIIAAGQKAGELSSAEASEEKIVSLISGIAN